MARLPGLSWGPGPRRGCAPWLFCGIYDSDLAPVSVGFPFYGFKGGPVYLKVGLFAGLLRPNGFQHWVILQLNKPKMPFWNNAKEALDGISSLERLRDTPRERALFRAFLTQIAHGVELAYRERFRARLINRLGLEFLTQIAHIPIVSDFAEVTV